MFPVLCSGSRSLPASFAPVVAAALASVPGCVPFVGCAAGADALVRLAAPGARVFRAASRVPAALVARSVLCVRSAVAAGASRAFVFVSAGCPAGVVPGPAWVGGGGSGSWASAALAAGLGLSVSVVWCGAGAPVLPAWPGRWLPGPVFAGAPSFVFVPAAPAAPAQLSLF